MNPLADQFATFDVDPDEQRILDRVASRFECATADGCILLSGAKCAAGRPRMQIEGYHTRCARVIVALRDDRPIHETWKWQTRHLCGNPACCNPEHLTWGTQDQNEADKATHETSMNGERHWNSRLTEQQARTILHDPRTHSVIAAEYGVSDRTVSDIKCGRTWRHLHDKPAATA